MMRRRMVQWAHIRLARSVARTETRCYSCKYPIVPYDEVYRPSIGAVALFEACTVDCAKRHVRAPMQVAYE